MALNGSKGQLLQFIINDSNTGAWKVQMESTETVDASCSIAVQRQRDIRSCNLKLVEAPPIPSLSDEEEGWWDFIQEYSCTVSVAVDQKQPGVSTTTIREFKVGDIVQMEAMLADQYNGIYGKLVKYDEEKKRWVVKLGDKSAKVMSIKSMNLIFIRSPKAPAL